MRKVRGLPSRAFFPSILASFARAIRALQSKSWVEAGASSLLLPGDRMATPPEFSRASLRLFTARYFLDVRCDIVFDGCMGHPGSPKTRATVPRLAPLNKEIRHFSVWRQGANVLYIFRPFVIRCCGYALPGFRLHFRESPFFEQAFRCGAAVYFFGKSCRSAGSRQSLPRRLYWCVSANRRAGGTFAFGAPWPALRLHVDDAGFREPPPA